MLHGAIRDLLQDFRSTRRLTLMCYASQEYFDLLKKADPVGATRREQGACLILQAIRGPTREARQTTSQAYVVVSSCYERSPLDWDLTLAVTVWTEMSMTSAPWPSSLRS